jgi:AraC-like DNA-binding protein
MGRVARPEVTPGSRSTRCYAVQPGWRLLIQDLGLNPAVVLRRAQLPADLLARAGTTIDSAQYHRLWRAIEAEADAGGATHVLPAGGHAGPVPLRIARALSADWFDPVLFSALCSADLASALERVSKFKRLICPMALTVENTGRCLTLTIEWLGPEEPPPPVLVAFELAFFVQLARMATRTAIRPSRVCSPVVLQPLLDYADYFGAPISNAAPARLEFSAEDARRPFLTVNTALWAFFEPALRQRLADLDARATTTARVRSALLEGLPAGDVAMAAVCRKLGLSARTLQRRLQDEGTSFQRTLDAVRHELAQHYLQHSAMSGAEISFLLGFEDPNSFVRAFQAWTGTTPQTVRAATSRTAS